jgi:hypothetical protein
MHSDELQAECWAKLAQILSGGHLTKCKSRGKAFGFIKTSFQNHLRSLVQKYAFTEKRTGIKPPPREGAATLLISAQPHTVNLDDDERMFQVGHLDSAFGIFEFLETLEQWLTADERNVLRHLMVDRGSAVSADFMGKSEANFNSIKASIRSKARAILRDNSPFDPNPVAAGEANLAEGRVMMQNKPMTHSQITLSREEFHNVIWTTPASQLCKVWGINPHQMSKLCEKFNIPRPGPDYWPLLRLGRTVERGILPPPPTGAVQSVLIAPTPKRSAKPRSSEQLAAGKEKNLSTAIPKTPVRVAQDFRKVHPLIQKSRELLEAASPDRYGRVGPRWNKGSVNVVTTKQNMRRALLILDAVFRALEAKGHEAEVVEERERFDTRIRIGDETVRVKILERTIQREKQPSAEEKERSYFWGRYTYEPTNLLTFSIDEYCNIAQKEWTDTEQQKLEDSISEIIGAIINAGETLRLRSIERREEERRRVEAEKRAFELRKLWEQERARRKHLQEQAELWEKVNRLRDFIGCCEVRLANKNELNQDSPASRWLEWARRCADELDPMNNDYLAEAIRALPQDPIRIASVPNR